MRSIHMRLTTIEKQIDITDGCRMFFIDFDGIHCPLDYIPDLPAGYTDEELAAYKKIYYRGEVIIFDERGMHD